MSERALHKSWQDKRPGWTHRVRWYEGEDDIRLSFETPISRHNDWYRLEEREMAQAAYDSFRSLHGQRVAS